MDDDDFTPAEYGERDLNPVEIETGALRALADAVDDLNAAKAATRNGVLDDYCENALREVRKALDMAIWGME